MQGKTQGHCKPKTIQNPSKKQNHSHQFTSFDSAAEARNKQPAKGSADCSSDESSDLAILTLTLFKAVFFAQKPHHGRSPFSIFRRASGILGNPTVAPVHAGVLVTRVPDPRRRQQRSSSVQMVLLQFLDTTNTNNMNTE